MEIALRRPQSFLPALAVLALGALIVHVFVIEAILAAVLRGQVLSDWFSFYSAGAIVRAGDAAHLYDASVQAATQRRLFGEITPMGYPLPAFAAFLFAPFSRLSFTQSYLLWLALNLALLAALVRLSWRWLDALPPVLRAVYLGCAACITVPVTLLAGQVDLVVLAGLAGCYALLRKERPFLGGSILALALLKPHLAAAVILLLLVKGQWRALAGLAATGAPLLLVPLLVSGPRLFVDQARLLVSYTSTVSDYRVNADRMINIRGPITGITGSSDVWLWLPVLALVAAAACYVAVRIWLERPALDPQSWALAFALPLLYSPHLHAQTIVLLIAAAGLYLAADQASATPRADAQHVLLGFIAFTVLWLAGLAGVALLSLPIMGAFALFARRWPATVRQSAAQPAPARLSWAYEPPATSAHA